MKIETFGELKLNIMTLVNTIFPENTFSDILGTPLQLDIEFKSKYKNRYISSFIEEIVENYSNIVNDEYMGIKDDGQLIIRYIIRDRFKKKWDKLFKLLDENYDPLSPFDITLIEKSTDDFITIKDSTSYNDRDNVYGFNSNESSPSNDNLGETIKEYERENPKTRDYTRKGNIGNITRQQLVEEERKVLNYQILDVIYEDIVSIVCRNTYKID